MGVSEITELGRQGEGQQEVGTWQYPSALLLEPATCLIAVALRAVTIATRVVTVLQGTAIVALPEMPTESGGATALDVAHGPEV
jgi:hypothetical protein